MAMKESGIEWVGLIPDTWSVIPNKYVMHKEKNLCEKWSGEDVMSLTMNGVIVRDLQNPTGKMPATFDGYQYIEDGDLLMCLFDIDVTPRCVGRVTHEGVTSPAYSNFKVHDNASRDYFYYYYLMVDNTKELLHLAKNLRHSFTEEQLGQLKVPMPPLSEQQAIADYLDETCSKIDEIIAEAKASIDEYKELKQSVIFEAVTKGLDKNVEMKDSGIEWIGRIPKHWSLVKSNRFITSTQNGISRRDLEKSTGNIVLKLRNITEIGEIDYSYTNRIELSNKEFENYILQIGDLLFVRVNGSKALVGKCAIFNGNNEPVAYNDHIIRVQINKFCVGEYFKWYLLSQSGKTEIALHINTSAGQYTISGQGLKDIYVSLPPIHEQENIIMFLGNKCKRIDSLISEKESLINDLEAYKKSLIYEVVTGKRRVV